MMLASNPAAPRLRWNSIFVKLAMLVVAAATIITAVTSYTYTRAMISQLERQMVHAVEEVNALVAGQIASAVIARAVAPIEAQLSVLGQESGSEVRQGIVLDANGEILVSKGISPEDATMLADLARAAITSGTRQSGGGGLFVADPVVNTLSGAVSGALATSWTLDHLRAEAQSARLRVVALVAAITLAGVVALVLVIRNSITQPMIRIAAGVNRLAENDFEVDFESSRRADELGDIGRALTILKARLVEARDSERQHRFRGAALATSSAAIMMVDARMRIIAMNEAVQDILEHYVEDFRKLLPDFDPKNVVGSEMDRFHSGALRERVRAVMADAARMPHQATIAAGEARFRLTINQVLDAAGGLEGYVVEWNDITAQFMQSAILKAIDANQVKAEFGLDGALLHGNAHFARALGTTVEGLSGLSHDAIFAFDKGLSLERGEVLERLNGGDAVYGSFRVLRRDGQEGVIDGGFTPVLDGFCASFSSAATPLKRSDR